MPKFFYNWLCSLSDEQAVEMWEYFDESFTNCEDVVAHICISHPEVYTALCFDPDDLNPKVEIPRS